MKKCTHCGNSIEITEYDAKFAIVKLEEKQTDHPSVPTRLKLDTNAYMPLRPYLCNACGHVDLFGYNPDIKE